VADAIRLAGPQIPVVAARFGEPNFCALIPASAILIGMADRVPGCVDMETDNRGKKYDEALPSVAVHSLEERGRESGKPHKQREAHGCDGCLRAPSIEVNIRVRPSQDYLDLLFSAPAETESADRLFAALAKSLKAHREGFRQQVDQKQR
jgi:hypothetical protein